ncbi:MAG: hypothetical protein V1745_04415 [Patescibacteria group bacterium]
MTRFIAFVLMLAALGAGCSGRADDVDRLGDTTAKTPTKTGFALLSGANDVGGQPITHADTSYRWMLSTLLPPTFLDGRGSYSGAKLGESIEVQLGVSGTPEQDLATFRGLSGITDVETGSLGGWTVTAGRDTAQDRQVFRATRADATVPEAYHVIECLAVTHSERNFWESCRTFIDHATVTPTSPAPVTP